MHAYLPMSTSIKQEQLSQPLLSSALTVDVLAEISAHELPLGRVSAKDEPTVYDIAIPPPDPSVPYLNLDPSVHRLILTINF